MRPYTTGTMRSFTQYPALSSLPLGLWMFGASMFSLVLYIWLTPLVPTLFSVLFFTLGVIVTMRWYSWACAKPFMGCNPSMSSGVHATNALNVVGSFTPPLSLAFGYLQTVVTNFRRIKKPDYVRVIAQVEGEHAGSYAIDIDGLYTAKALLAQSCMSSSEDLPDGDTRVPRAVAILIHGLTGGSNESYMKSQCRTLVQKGLDVVCLNFRGCCGSDLETPIAYCAAFTTDLRHLVNHLSELMPECPLVAVGNSLGAIMLAKYCAEEGESCKLRGGVSISNPLHMIPADDKLNESFISSTLFVPRLCQRLISYGKKHKHMLSTREDYDLSILEKKKAAKMTFGTFETALLCPMFGYSDRYEYYNDASTYPRHIQDIRTNLCILVALDDPFIATQSVVDTMRMIRKSKSEACLVATRAGGHVAFLSDWSRTIPTWSELFASEFIESLIC